MAGPVLECAKRSRLSDVELPTSSQVDLMKVCSWKGFQERRYSLRLCKFINLASKAKSKLEPVYLH
jgi:hypothetical protein